MGTPFFVLSGGLAAWGKGLPSASRLRAGHVPPAPPACGPTPCPPWAAAGPPPAPSSPCRSGRGNVAAKAAPAARPGQVGRQPLRGGTPPQSKAKASRLRRALLCSSPAPVAAQVLRGGPAPTSGGFGAVRPSGPVGGAPASLASPATPAAQAVPRGSAYALAARRSGPGPLAGGTAPQPSRGPGCGLLLQPLPLRGPQFRPPRALAAQAPPSPRFARGGAQGTPPAGGSAGRCPGRQGQGKPRAGRQAAHRRGPCLPVPRPAMGQRGGCPALCGPPAPSHSGKRWCCYVCCCLSCLSCWPGLVAGLPSWWCLWLVAVPVCPVALALCSGGGFCLSAGGGFSSRHLLACWCFCRSAGRRSLRVAAPPWVLSLAGGGPALGAVPCR